MAKDFMKYIEIKKKNIISTLVTLGISALLIGNIWYKDKKESYWLAIKQPVSTDCVATLNVVGNVSNFTAFEKVVEDFNEIYPNIKVNYSKLEGDYTAGLKKRISREDDIDIFMSQYYSIVNNKEIYSNVVNLFDLDIDLSAVERGDCAFCIDDDGALLRVPLGETGYGMLVNTTLLNTLGIQIPKNYKEFTEDCLTIKKQGYVPVLGSFDNGDMFTSMCTAYFFSSLLSVADADQVRNDLVSGVDGCGEYARECFERLSDFMYYDCLDYGENVRLADGNEAVIKRFFKGDVAFVPCKTEVMSMLIRNENSFMKGNDSYFDYEFVPVPMGDESGFNYADTWNGFSINKNSKNVAPAKALLEFVTQKDELNKFAKEQGIPSVCRDLDDIDEKYSMLKSLPKEYVVYKSEIITSTVVINAFDTAVGALGRREKTVDEAVIFFEQLIKENR